MECVQHLSPNSSLSSLTSPTPTRQDLWSQTKITRERSQLANYRIIQICQPSHIFSDLRHLTFNLSFYPANTDIFLLDAYYTPVLVTRVKTEGSLKIVKGTAEFQGSTCVESVIYNSTVNQWERLLEPASEKVVPIRVNFMVGKVDTTQVVDNMEEIPIVAATLSIESVTEEEDIGPEEKMRLFFDQNILW